MRLISLVSRLKSLGCFGHFIVVELSFPLLSGEVETVRRETFDCHDLEVSVEHHPYYEMAH